jgi:hypothetical protein
MRAISCLLRATDPPPFTVTTFGSILSVWPRPKASSNATRQARDGGADYSETSGGGV